MESKKEKAMALFKEGYNCSQSVFLAYAEDYNIDRELALKLSCSFGAGMGRMREVCGAVSGMLLVAGLETGATAGKDADQKKANYDMVQKLAEAFREKNGSIYCKVLLGLVSENDVVKPFNNTTPDKRTAEYYKKRPCLDLVGDACDILDSILLKNEDN